MEVVDSSVFVDEGFAIVVDAEDEEEVEEAEDEVFVTVVAAEEEEEAEEAEDEAEVDEALDSVDVQVVEDVPTPPDVDGAAVVEDDEEERRMMIAGTLALPAFGVGLVVVVVVVANRRVDVVICLEKSRKVEVFEKKTNAHHFT